MGSRPVVVCVAGMHRSGTSMVTRLLNRCGLDLGPESALLPPDVNNRDGYWEHRDFMALNEAVLGAFGAAWDRPTTTNGEWWTAPELAALRAQASDLVARFADRPCWGWKDPRNSVLLPFWKHLLPQLRVVVCVRSPLEVVASLRRRGDAVADTGLALWLAYYDRLLAALGTDDRLVTHFDAYAHDAPAELQRLVTWLGLDVDAATIRHAAETVDDTLRHERATAAEAFLAIGDPDVMDCYLELCADAGAVFRAAIAARPTGTLPATAFDPLHRCSRAPLYRRVVRLETCVVERERTLAALSDRAATLERELAALTVTSAAHAAAAAAATARAQALAAEIATLTHSRGWRLLERLWRVRLGLLPSGSRREQMFLKLAGRLAASPPAERSPRAG